MLKIALSPREPKCDFETKERRGTRGVFAIIDGNRLMRAMRNLSDAGT